MAFKKGQSGNPAGRRLGQVNKFTTLKEKFLEAFRQTGDTAGLCKWIQANPRNRAMFYQMLTKLFPQEQVHTGEVKAKLTFDFGDNGNGNGTEDRGV